jgi:hypothetical protein
MEATSTLLESIRVGYYGKNEQNIKWKVSIITKKKNVYYVQTYPNTSYIYRIRLG